MSMHQLNSRRHANTTTSLPSNLRMLNTERNRLQKLLKEELRMTIIAKRQARGQGDLKVDFPDPKPHQLSMAEVERRERRREQNRRAAQRCRRKKRMNQMSVLQNYEWIVTHNHQLQEEVDQLRQERSQLQSVLKAHCDACTCTHAHTLLSHALSTSPTVKVEPAEDLPASGHVGFGTGPPMASCVSESWRYQSADSMMSSCSLESPEQQNYSNSQPGHFQSAPFTSFASSVSCSPSGAFQAQNDQMNLSSPAQSNGPNHMNLNNPVQSNGSNHMNLSSPAQSNGPNHMNLNNPVQSNGSNHMNLSSSAQSNGPNHMNLSNSAQSNGSNHMNLSNPTRSNGPDGPNHINLNNSQSNGPNHINLSNAQNNGTNHMNLSSSQSNGANHMNLSTPIQSNGPHHMNLSSPQSNGTNRTNICSPQSKGLNHMNLQNPQNNGPGHISLASPLGNGSSRGNRTGESSTLQAPSQPVYSATTITSGGLTSLSPAMSYNSGQPAYNALPISTGGSVNVLEELAYMPNGLRACVFQEEAATPLSADGRRSISSVSSDVSAMSEQQNGDIISAASKHEDQVQVPVGALYSTDDVSSNDVSQLLSQINQNDLIFQQGGSLDEVFSESVVGISSLQDHFLHNM